MASSAAACPSSRMLARRGANCVVSGGTIGAGSEWISCRTSASGSNSTRGATCADAWIRTGPGFSSTRTASPMRLSISAIGSPPSATSGSGSGIRACTGRLSGRATAVAVRRLRPADGAAAKRSPSAGRGAAVIGFSGTGALIIGRAPEGGAAGAWRGGAAVRRTGTTGAGRAGVAFMSALIKSAIGSNGGWGAGIVAGAGAAAACPLNPKSNEKSPDCCGCSWGVGMGSGGIAGMTDGPCAKERFSLTVRSSGKRMGGAAWAGAGTERCASASAARAAMRSLRLGIEPPRLGSLRAAACGARPRSSLPTGALATGWSMPGIRIEPVSGARCSVCGAAPEAGMTTGAGAGVAIGRDMSMPGMRNGAESRPEPGRSARDPGRDRPARDAAAQAAAASPSASPARK